MKAKKIVYLMLIMVVLISGCNHQNNNMEESKKTSFSNEKTSDSTTKPSSIVSTAVPTTAIPTTLPTENHNKKEDAPVDMQKQITLRKKLRILYITKMVKAYNSAGYRGGKTNYSYGKTALCQYRRTCFAEE